MKICQVTSNEEKQRITRQVLEALPKWFGIPEARENYISESRDQLFFCAYGIAREVFLSATKAASEAVSAFMQVTTVQLGKYEEYDDTNRFYLSLGFQEFEVFPTLWDAWNPCQIYIMTI